MPQRADILAAQVVAAVQFNGAGTNYIVQTPTGVLYLVYVDTGSDVAFRKSTDGGLTWSVPTIVYAGTVTALSIWYDRWSNISAGLIHCAYQESVSDDTLYRTIDTESSDALSTQTTIFAGASTASGGALSITRARGGNVYCATMIDAGAEGRFYRLPNANVPNGAWDAARSTCFEAATQDQVILVPGFAADNQDIMCLFWDASANEISRKVYDDSGNSWAETSIATSMVDTIATTSFPHYNATVDLTNSKIIMVAWSAVDAANADLRCWTIDESSITETSTNVVLNSTDDQHLAGITLDTAMGKWCVFYGGKSDGSETVGTNVHLYMKCSKDSGATWGPETQLSTRQSNMKWLACVPILSMGESPVAYLDDIALDEILINVALPQRRATVALGI